MPGGTAASHLARRSQPVHLDLPICRHEIDEWRRAHPGETAVPLVEDVPEIRAALESWDVQDLLRTDAAVQPERSLAALVQRVLDHLPVHYGNVLEWKYLEDAPVADIAARLDVSAKAAESLLTRARAAFRDLAAALAPELDHRPSHQATGSTAMSEPLTPGPDETPIRDLLVLAGRRPEPAPFRTTRVRAAVEAEWRRSMPRLSRWRLRTLAAAVLGVTLALWSRNAAPPPATPPAALPLATITRISGMVQMSAAGSAFQLAAAGAHLSAGAIVDAAAGRVLLTFGSGHWCASIVVHGLSWKRPIGCG